MTDDIRIVQDIFAAPAVNTLEGRIGPLLSAARGTCHFIELPAGGYCEAHSHPTESLIYTARGQWVLCAAGRRHHMREGSLFWFGDHVATGYEIPFEQPATIVIFKTQAADPNTDFVDYLQRMGAGLEADHDAGTAFRLDELPDDHPALLYATGLGYATRTRNLLRGGWRVDRVERGWLDGCAAVHGNPA